MKIGSNVEPDTVVCIIEAMKLMNEIQAETTGEVVKIYVENGQPVEYGQPLFGIKKVARFSSTSNVHVPVLDRRTLDVRLLILDQS